MEEEEEEAKEEEKVSEGSRKWNPIHYPHHHFHSTQTHHDRSLSDSQTQFQERPILRLRDSHFSDGDVVVFPPINHEGLHLSLTPSPSLSNQDGNQQELHKSSCSPCQENGLWVPPPPDTLLAVGGEVAKWLGIGFELLRSKVNRVASSLGSFAALGGMNKSLISSASRVAAVVLVWWLYAVVFRRRRRHLRLRKESRDHLILLIKEKDEKINQLLHQIAQMNQLLLALHRDSLSGTGGLTK